VKNQKEERECEAFSVASIITELRPFVTGTVLNKDDDFIYDNVREAIVHKYKCAKSGDEFGWIKRVSEGLKFKTKLKKLLNCSFKIQVFDLVDTLQYFKVKNHLPLWSTVRTDNFASEHQIKKIHVIEQPGIKSPNLAIVLSDVVKHEEELVFIVQNCWGKSFGYCGYEYVKAKNGWLGNPSFLISDPTCISADS